MPRGRRRSSAGLCANLAADETAHLSPLAVSALRQQAEARLTSLMRRGASIRGAAAPGLCNQPPLCPCRWPSRGLKAHPTSLPLLRSMARRHSPSGQRRHVAVQPVGWRIAGGWRRPAGRHGFAGAGERSLPRAWLHPAPAAALQPAAPHLSGAPEGNRH